jgi:endonuclease I
MKRLLQLQYLAIILLLMNLTLMAQGNYYDAISVSKPSLIQDLHNLINPHTVISYDNFDETNIANFAARDTTDGKKYVTCVYSGEKYIYTPPFSWGYYSREHTFCHSWMPTYPSTDGPEYSDQHHLFPTNQNSSNGVRNNYPLGEVATVTSVYLGDKFGKDIKGKTVFEPRNEHKGDAARALFYMVVCYDGSRGKWTIPNSVSNQDLDVLRKWNKEDPPSAWEKARNEYIYSIQHNRNPFVDHPEYANYIDFTNDTYIPGGLSDYAPVVVTSPMTNITETSASCGGVITSDSGYVVTVSGVCWNTYGNPTVSDNKTTDGTLTGAFTSQVASLSAGTVYHIRAYATNIKGTGYGNDVSFTTSCTPAIPVAYTSNATSVSSTTAILNGKVNPDFSQTAVAFEYGPTISYGTTTDASQSPVAASSALINVSCRLSGLTPSSTYHYRTKAANTIGAALGEDMTFTTDAAGSGTVGQVISEDFAGMTDGTFTSPSGTDLFSSTGSGDAGFHTKGWMGSKIYSAAGAVKCGTSSAAGYLVSPEVDLSGNNGKFSVSLDLQTWKTTAADNSLVQIFLAPDGTTFSQIGSDITPAADVMTNYKIDGTNGTANSKIKINQKNATKGRFFVDNFTLTVDKPLAVKDNKAVPSGYYLSQNYPNPFNPSTVISYNIPASGYVVLSVYDMLGREVRTLVDGFKQQGSHNVSFDAANLNSGVYLYRISANGFTMMKKMTLLK